MDDSRNLLTETTEMLEANGKTPSDVRWIGTEGGSTPAMGTWEDFVKLANFEYDAGFGLQVVRANLVIVGDDWWMERHEYDGSEWWEFKSRPEPAKDAAALRLEDLKDSPM